MKTKEEHTHSSYNRDEIKRSTECGCFYCLKRFSPEEITIWIDGGETAMCPYCNIDSVLPNASVVLSDELLQQMQTEWF